MSHPDKKVIVVAGATGAQGGSVVRFLLKDGKYHIKAVTRKPDSPAALGAYRSFQQRWAHPMLRRIVNQSCLHHLGTSVVLPLIPLSSLE